MDNTIVAALIGVVGGLLGVLLGSIISRKASSEAVKSSNENAITIMRRQEFFSASSKFKASVLYELTGFYPIDQHWEKKEFHRLYNSIPKINSFAAEFRQFVTSKADFDKALSEYNKYCREKTEGKVFVLDFSKSMPGSKSQKDYMEDFENIVKHLLSFANEK